MLPFSALALTVVVAAAPPAVDAAALMKQSEARHRLAFEDVVVAMTVQNDKGTQARVARMTTAQDPAGKRGDRLIIRFDAPADVAGTAMLSVENRGGEDDQWLYLPAFRKTRRVGSAERGDRFAGTDFFYEDLKHHAVDDFQWTFLREEACGSATCYVLESTPATDKVKKDSPYSKSQVWLQKDNLVVHTMRAFDKAGRPLKEIRAQKWTRIAGDTWRADESVCVDVQRKSRTTVTVQSRKTAAKADDALFNADRLAQP
jgi:hypothetical protein